VERGVAVVGVGFETWKARGDSLVAKDEFEAEVSARFDTSVS
jgi:hypothetical protein